MEVGFRDLDVVAEHVVVGDLERTDPGSFPFGLLEFGDPVAAVCDDMSDFVKIPVVSFPDDTAVFVDERRLVDDRGKNQIGDAVKGGDLFEFVFEEAFGAAEFGGEFGNGGQTRGESEKITRRGVSVGDPAGDPFDVGEPGEDGPGPGEEDGAPGEEPDGVETMIYLFRRGQRPGDGASQNTAPHGSFGPVEKAEEGRIIPVASEGIEDLEIPERDRVQDHRVVCVFSGESADVGETRFLGLFCIAESGCGSIDAFCGTDIESVQGGDAKCGGEFGGAVGEEA